MGDEVKNLAWDDSLLIKAYDTSVNLAHEDLARRIADSTNSRAEANKKMADTETLTGTGASTPEQLSFKVGDFARATYTDGRDYEGTIISIEEETGTCVLRYLGYENEQVVLLNELLRSWGETARNEQCIQAENDGEHEEQRAKVSKKSSKAKHGGASGNLAAGLRMPPAPPLPPLFSPAGGIEGEAGQDLAAMLMSWYMSGYYTGLYQGKMQGHASKQKKSSKK